MRLFFQLDDENATGNKHNSLDNVTVSGRSCVTSSIISTGFISGSMITGVHCSHIEADQCVLINVTANRIVAPAGSLLYNIVDKSPDGIVLVPDEVRVGVFSADGSHEVIKSSLTIDGGGWVVLKLLCIIKFVLFINFYTLLFIICTFSCY